MHRYSFRIYAPEPAPLLMGNAVKMQHDLDTYGD